MTTFRMTVEMDNAAFDGDASRELARILAKATMQMLDGVIYAPTRDSNGNAVGSWEVTA